MGRSIVEESRNGAKMHVPLQCASCAPRIYPHWPHPSLALPGPAALKGKVGPPERLNSRKQGEIKNDPDRSLHVEEWQILFINAHK